MHGSACNTFMDPLIVSAAGGLQSRMDSLSLLANNLANAASSGYKSDREFYGLYASAEADTDLGTAPNLPVIQRQWTDFSQGVLQPTGNQLDIALSGKGFLAVNSPQGILYTRNGSLHINSNGELTTNEGYTVQNASGGTIKVTTGAPVEIATDGTVRQNGVVNGQVRLVDFKSTDPLAKTSGTCFENTDVKNAATTAVGTEVQQGKLEASNVAVPEAAMRLVGVMRQFEMLQKAVSMGVDMNSKAIQEVARVGA